MLQIINQDVVPTLCVYRKRNATKARSFYYWYVSVCDATDHKWRVPFGTIYACYKKSTKMSYPLYAFTEKGTQQKRDTFIIGTYLVCDTTQHEGRVMRLQKRTQQKRDTFIIGTYLVCEATQHEGRVSFDKTCPFYKSERYRSHCISRNGTQQNLFAFSIGTFLICDATQHKWRVPWDKIHACYK